jgi:hypothetical protein
MCWQVVQAMWVKQAARDPELKYTIKITSQASPTSVLQGFTARALQPAVHSMRHWPQSLGPLSGPCTAASSISTHKRQLNPGLLAGLDHLASPHSGLTSATMCAVCRA